MVGPKLHRNNLALQAARLVCVVLYDLPHPTRRQVKSIAGVMDSWQHTVVAATIDSEVVSTGSLMDFFGTDMIVNVATYPEHRGDGIGAQVIGEIEEIAAVRSIGRLSLDARPLAIPFYERLGYTPNPVPPRGPHNSQSMSKIL